MKYPVDTWEWFGGAAHFICGQWCRFHMATVVGKVLVSTIGEYVHPRHGGSEKEEWDWLKENWPGEDIRPDRKYETMVFVAGKRCDTPECGCGMPRLSIYTELDSRGYNTAKDATKGHMDMCLEWANMDQDDAIGKQEELEL
jgi:hypothetical protein